MDKSDTCPIGLVKHRAGYMDDDLTDEERRFLKLVREGRIDELSTFLTVNVNLNVDCCDYQGHKALEIAVSTKNSEVVAFFLKHVPISIIHYYCAVLQAVFEDDDLILEILLDRAEEDNRQRLRDLIAGGPECTNCLPEVAVTSLTPIMAAATQGSIKITRMFLERGYCIQKPHSPKCCCQEHCIRRSQGGETLTESMSRINAYKALASPTYLILTSEDPVLSAFELSRELNNLSKELPEHQKEYKRLSSQCSNFAANLLNQCRNTEEVQIVLVQRQGLNDPRPHRFSRLHLAVQYEQKEFVTHASCQQVLRSLWVDNLGSWYSWPFRWKAFHVIKHAVLTPFVAIAFIFIPKAEIIGPLRIPLNRFIYSATSYIFFLCLLLGTLLNDRRYEIHSPVTWTEMAVGCFIIGHSWDILTNLISIGFKNYFRSWWCVFDLIMFFAFFITEMLWFGVFLYNTISEDSSHSSNRMSWYWYHPILIGEGIYAAASVLAFSRLLLWFQVNSRLGPLGTSIKYMIVDVARFFMMFFIIMFAFATGINSIYKNYKDSSRMEEKEIVEQPDAFITLKSTFKSLFWAIFGMGEPDFAQIIVGSNSSTNDTEDKQHFFTEGVGYSLWGLYHMVTVVVLLNMLIAMMAESYQRVETNSDLEWKFACSTLWLSVFDNHSVVPPPFNLIPSMHRVTVLFHWVIGAFRGAFSSGLGKSSWSAKKCCYNQSEVDHGVRKSEEETYEKLMVQLIRRYLHCTKLQSAVPNFVENFKDNLKEQLLHDIKKAVEDPLMKLLNSISLFEQAHLPTVSLSALSVGVQTRPLKPTTSPSPATSRHTRSIPKPPASSSPTSTRLSPGRTS